jgi:HD-GYP domain-containing protein (c-di-GMP phosphodiesterase class II)
MTDRYRNIEIAVKTIRPGARYAYDLYDESGNVILEAHHPISGALINHLLLNNIHYLYYNKQQQQFDDSLQRYKITKQLVDQKLQNDLNNNVKDLIDHIREIYNYSSEASISKARIDQSRDLVYQLLDQLEENRDAVFNPAMKLKDLDSYHYHHSANVGILGALIGLNLEYHQDVRVAMGVGGLFHDIGMSVIPNDILQKKGRLTEQEYGLVKEHTHIGYKFVEHNPFMQDLEKRIVLLHHERADGSGYPFGFEHTHYQGRIPKEVRVMSLCDVYVALVIRRPGVEPYHSKKALRLILNMVFAPYKTDYKFLPSDFREFVRALGFTVNQGRFFLDEGDMIRLNSGEVALIEEMNTLYPLNPKIKLLTDQKLQKLKRPVQVDMLQDYTSYIANVFEKKQGEEKSNTLTIHKALHPENY